MAVIVYGMDMPETCGECKFYYDTFCRAEDRLAGPAFTMPGWCPLRYKYIKKYATQKELSTRRDVVMDRVKTRQQRIYYERKNAGCCVMCGKKDFRTEYLHKINCEWCSKHVSQMNKLREERRKTENVNKRKTSTQY